MYCEDSRLMMATRVIRIMCAVTTRVSVRAGRTVRYTCCQKSRSAWIFEIDGKIGFAAERNRISR